MLFVISSTANVAMPAARPESRINGRPTRSANAAPTPAASASDVTFPTFVWTRKCASPGMIAVFWSGGTVSTPAVHTPSATKAMWPNETTPEFPTKT